MSRSATRCSPPIPTAGGTGPGRSSGSSPARARSTSSRSLSTRTPAGPVTPAASPPPAPTRSGSRASAGTYVQVSAVKAVGRQAQRVHNLSVDGPSTYYVAAGWLNLLVHNSGCVTLKLKYGADWTDEMKKAADDKVAALNKAAAEGKLVTTKPPKRLGRNNQRYTNETGETVDSSEFDIDHIIDLQLGGADAVSNMNPLFRS